MERIPGSLGADPEIENTLNRNFSTSSTRGSVLGAALKPASIPTDGPRTEGQSPRQPSAQVRKMRELNKQQHRVLSAGLEPDMENLIMEKVLPAKRAAIEAFTDGAGRPGFTDTIDPYSPCLREIDRRIRGTGFDNPRDENDLTCRAIAQVAVDHEKILAIKNPGDQKPCR